MKTLFEATKPRADVLKGVLRDEVFAARLEDVVRGKADPVYQDPETYFANTQATGGLRSLLTEALGRATSERPDAAPVIRLETSFGGGKTHSLIALHHLAAAGWKPPDIGAFVDPSVLPESPVKVAAVVGSALDPSQGVRHDEATTYTLWGELAYQLGTYNEVRESDEKRRAPGTGTLERAFSQKPLIIMMDELARYLEVADGYETGRNTLADQTVAFLMALFEFAASTDQIAVVYTLASSKDAFADQTARLIAALQDAKAVSARAEHVITPTQENEIALIVRKRLFEEVDASTAVTVAKSYHEALQEQLDKDGDLPSNAADAGYATDIETDYPFHPELLRLLNEKVSTIPNFQRTRGALRLLARALRNMFEERPKDVYLIHPYHIDLGDEDIVNDLTSRLDRPIYKQVVEADIANPKAGAKAHAALVDAPLLAADKPAFAQRMATTVFLHSLVQGIAAGVTPTEAKLAVYAPGDDIGLLEKQLEGLLDTAWFLDFAGNRLRFSTEPSLVKLVADEVGLVGVTAAKRELDQRIRKIWQKGVFDPEFFPSEPSDVGDSFERPRLALMHYDAETVSAADSAPPDLVMHLFDRAGTAQGFRKFRNNALFLVADADAVPHAVEEAQRYLAINRIVGDTGRFNEFNKEQKGRLKKMAEEAELTLRVAITRTYKHLFYPDSSAPKDNQQLARVQLPAQDQGEVDRDQSQVVLRMLRDLGKVRTADDADIAPRYVRDKAWPANADRATPRQLQKEFASRINLPILLDINKLKESIKIGIRSGEWAYFDQAKGCAYTKESTTTPLVQVSDEVEVVLVEAAATLPICDGPKGKQTEENCPVCGHPEDQCICAKPRPPAPATLRASGAPAQAFQGLVDQATDQKVKKLAAVAFRIDGIGAVFARDLIAMALAVPQLPKSDIEVQMQGSFSLKDGSRMKFEFTGAWERYRGVHDVIRKAEKDIEDAGGRLTLSLQFPDGLMVSDSDMESMRDTFQQLNPGSMELSARPWEETT